MVRTVSQPLRHLVLVLSAGLLAIAPAGRPARAAEEPPTRLGLELQGSAYLPYGDWLARSPAGGSSGDQRPSRYPKLLGPGGGGLLGLDLDPGGGPHFSLQLQLDHLGGGSWVSEAGQRGLTVSVSGFQWSVRSLVELPVLRHDRASFAFRLGLGVMGVAVEEYREYEHRTRRYDLPTALELTAGLAGSYALKPHFELVLGLDHHLGLPGADSSLALQDIHTAFSLHAGFRSWMSLL